MLTRRPASLRPLMTPASASARLDVTGELDEVVEAMVQHAVQ